jgi:uncharacterized coiled-coil DUF342 family protein
MNSDELHAELEQLRLQMANLRYYMTEAYPDWREAATVRLQALEEEERDLLRRLADAA